MTDSSLIWRICNEPGRLSMPNIKILNISLTVSAFSFPDIVWPVVIINAVLVHIAGRDDSPCMLKVFINKRLMLDGG